MGPLVLFDKSFLQSLSIDESVWFDNFYRSTICPIFYVETLADLEKNVRPNRTQEEEVSIIAQKFPERNSTPCPFHHEICRMELLGIKNIPMDARIPVQGGRPVESGGKKGIVYDTSPEADAFQRWQDQKFMEIERLYAKSWREGITSLDLKYLSSSLDSLGLHSTQCKNLNDVSSLVDTFINSPHLQLKLLELSMSILNIANQEKNLILQRWMVIGNPPLRYFAPFSFLNLKIEIFFNISISASLESAERISNRTDMAYLFYLPFCNIFVSNDRLHERSCGFFLRANQKFQWGLDLKKDLSNLNQHYLTYPEEVRQKGLHSFAYYPPKEIDFLTCRLYNAFLPNWRKSSEEQKPPKQNKKLAKKMTKMSEAPTAKYDPSFLDDKKIDFMSLKKSVHKKKGSWYQLPKDIKTN